MSCDVSKSVIWRPLVRVCIFWNNRKTREKVIVIILISICQRKQSYQVIQRLYLYVVLNGKIFVSTQIIYYCTIFISYFNLTVSNLVFNAMVSYSLKFGVSFKMFWWNISNPVRRLLRFKPVEICLSKPKDKAFSSSAVR